MKIPDDMPNSEVARIIDEFVRVERDRQIMKDRLINGMCFEPLAEKYGLSVNQTKNIVYKCWYRLFKRLKNG